ncbi:MAG: hypothetical protein ABEJ99_04430 [Candidatus Nanohaloarchaea archaeon]
MEDAKFRERKRLESIVSDIDRDVDSAIVEGAMDRKALRMLGFEGRIFLSAERSLEDLVEDVSRGSQKVVILTDFDSHGKEENKELNRALQGETDVINACRRQFGQQLTSTGRRTIEDTLPLFSSIEDKFVEAALDGLYFKE